MVVDQLVQHHGERGAARGVDDTLAPPTVCVRVSECVSVYVSVSQCRKSQERAGPPEARARITVRAVIVPPTYIPPTHQVDRWYSRAVGSVTKSTLGNNDAKVEQFVY